MRTDNSVATLDRENGMARQRAYHAAVDGKHPGIKVGTTNNDLNGFRRLFIAAAVLFGAGLVAGPVHAQSGPFPGMAGHWAGGGPVTLDDGSTERIRCHASYAVTGPEMGLTLTCASDSYKFNLEGRV